MHQLSNETLNSIKYIHIYNRWDLSLMGLSDKATMTKTNANMNLNFSTTLGKRTA